MIWGYPHLWKPKNLFNEGQYDVDSEYRDWKNIAAKQSMRWTASNKSGFPRLATKPSDVHPCCPVARFRPIPNSKSLCRDLTIHGGSPSSLVGANFMENHNPKFG